MSKKESRWCWNVEASLVSWFIIKYFFGYVQRWTCPVPPQTISVLFYKWKNEGIHTTWRQPGPRMSKYILQLYMSFYVQASSNRSLGCFPMSRQLTGHWRHRFSSSLCFWDTREGCSILSVMLSHIKIKVKEENKYFVCN